MFSPQFARGGWNGHGEPGLEIGFALPTVKTKRKRKKISPPGAILPIVSRELDYGLQMFGLGDLLEC